MSNIEIRCSFTKMVKVFDFKPHPKNRNTHSVEQIDRLSKLIAYQGVRHPIIVSNQSGYITAGHGRLEAARKLGMKEYPCDYQDYDSEESEYAFLQSDNAVALWAELDLSGINSDIGELGPDFDIEMLGLKDFVLDISEFKEPNQKGDPKLKEPQLRLCPNCNVVLENE